MTLERLTVHGFMRFTEPITLDVTALPEGLIAIVGENGAGKTTLLEAPIAALYRSWVSRGDLAPYASGKDSYLEAVYQVDGRGRFRARVNVDGIRRTSDAVLEVTPQGGAPRLLNDGKATTYDKAVRAIFPSPELLQASAFAAQNKAGDFITCKPAQRRELLGELLGLGAITTMGQTAKTVAGLVDQARGRLVAVRDVLARDTAPSLLATLEGAIAADAQDLTTETARKAEIGTRIELLEARLATMMDAVVAHGAVTQRIATLRASLQSQKAECGRVHTERIHAGETLSADQQRITVRADAERADLQKRIDGNRQVLDRADAIREAVDEIARVDAELVYCRATLTAQQREQDADTAALRAREQALGQLRQVAVRHERATLDASLLADVPCGGEGEYAGCQLLIGAQQAQASLADLVRQLEPKAVLADEIANIVASQDRRRVAMSVLQDAIVAGERAKASHQALAGYAEPLAKAEATIAGYRERLVQIERETTEALQDLTRRHATREMDLSARYQALEAECGQLESDLTAAEGERANLEDGNHEATALAAELKHGRADWDQVTGAIAAAEATRKDLQRRRAEFTAKQQEHQAIETRLHAVEQELLDWQLLTKALGKDGLPELEIDGAGPTISAYTNELLAVCHGTRFSLELVTQTAKADGKGMKSDVTVQVTDNAAGGIARDIADLSGGEQVIVSEALRNAIGIYVNRRAAMPVRTCWRDETTGALDPENATRYLAMLRKVQELGGYRHVLFITHNLDAAAQADAQVWIAQGVLTIAQPPYAAAA